MYETLKQLDDRYMQKAIEASSYSQDPNTRVGAVVVCRSISSMGFNQLISDKFTWNREGDFLDTKYPFVIHAEADAIKKSIFVASGFVYNEKTIYTTLFPCHECAKLIVQFGISRVVYLDNKYAETYSVRAAVMILEYNNVKVEKYQGQ